MCFRIPPKYWNIQCDGQVLSKPRLKRELSSKEVLFLQLKEELWIQKRHLVNIRWMDRQMGGWVNGWGVVWVHGWMGGWMDDE